MDTTRATIEWEDKRITFEGPSDFVEEQVRRFTLQESKKTVKDEQRGEYVGSSAAEMIQEKRPKGHHEIVAVLAFHLFEEGIQEFTEVEMKRAYIQAKVRPPKVIGQALRDAKNKYDYIDLGKKRGSYRLSPHGDRTVRFDLPRESS
ncbi:MAG: hypothetical protein M3O02_08470 [Acidobacteriota bacterium]|nr:hypothetical protein [Acidobacteriota bacterium]